MDSRDLKLTKEVWRKLHHTPELSGQETKTKEILKEYLTNYTTLSVVETPGLHTASYCYPEALLEKAGRIWETIIMH